MRFDTALYQRAMAALGRPADPPAESGEVASAQAIAAALCRRFEGFYSAPYLCPAGVATIGYGATHYLDGRRVQLTDPPISRETAERLLLRMIEREYMPAVLRLCPGVTNANRLAALIDFCFNLGQGQLAASTLRRRVNAGDWGAVPTELRKWVNANGRPLRGLVLRREAEAALI
jgi:lysozyme